MVPRKVIAVLPSGHRLPAARRKRHRGQGCKYAAHCNTTRRLKRASGSADAGTAHRGIGHGARENGVQANQEVKQSLVAIHAEAERVAAVMGDIVGASQRQSRDITQVDAGIAQMNQLTQSVAASSEESASVAEELASQAQEVQGLVETFELTSGRFEMVATASKMRRYGL